MFTSASQYLRTLEEGKASCVVIDTGLRGGISGLDLARAISTSRRPLPIIFIAPRPDEQTRDEAFRIGCAAYLEEPVLTEALISAIACSGANRH